VDPRAVVPADLAVQRPPCLASLRPVGHPSDRLDLVGIGQDPRIDRLVPQAAHERDEDGVVEVASRFRESQGTRHVDSHPGAHERASAWTRTWWGASTTRGPSIARVAAPPPARGEPRTG